MRETEECERLGLLTIQIVLDSEVEMLREIRNVCRHGFSTDNALINRAQQHRWWIENRTRVRGWLYMVEGEVIGYGLLRQTPDGRWWSSVAVVPYAAGKGYGGAITADLVRRSDVTVYATARLDNPAAMKLHREADWEETHRDEKLAHYRTRPHCHLGDSIEEWAKFGWCLT